MITMVMYAKVRRMFFREHLSIGRLGDAPVYRVTPEQEAMLRRVADVAHNSLNRFRFRRRLPFRRTDLARPTIVHGDWPIISGLAGFIGTAGTDLAGLLTGVAYLVAITLALNMLDFISVFYRVR